jgi:hypothetical protein
VQYEWYGNQSQWDGWWFIYVTRNRIVLKTGWSYLRPPAKNMQLCELDIQHRSTWRQHSIAYAIVYAMGETLVALMIGYGCEQGSPRSCASRRTQALSNGDLSFGLQFMHHKTLDTRLSLWKPSKLTKAWYIVMSAASMPLESDQPYALKRSTSFLLRIMFICTILCWLYLTRADLLLQPQEAGSWSSHNHVSLSMLPTRTHPWI